MKSIVSANRPIKSSHFNIDYANRCARRSCTRWNKIPPLRRLNRRRYQDIAIAYYNSNEHQQLIREYRAGLRRINTYLWPYRDPAFANWEEDDSNYGYSLITDQSSCVVKYATSYCAYKIFEATGEWPQKTSPERLDAKRWQQFLAEAGHTRILEDIPAKTIPPKESVVETPTPNLPLYTPYSQYQPSSVYIPEQRLFSSWNHYVGINPYEGEWGLVVWAESGDFFDKYGTRIIDVSSYVDKKYRFWAARVEDYIWVQIN